MRISSIIATVTFLAATPCMAQVVIAPAGSDAAHHAERAQRQENVARHHDAKARQNAAMGHYRAAAHEQDKARDHQDMAQHQEHRAVNDATHY